MAEVVIGHDVNTLFKAIAKGEFVHAQQAVFCAGAKREFQCDAEFNAEQGLSSGH
jgi:hypothetical protein